MNTLCKTLLCGAAALMLAGTSVAQTRQAVQGCGHAEHVQHGTGAPQRFPRLADG